MWNCLTSKEIWSHLQRRQLESRSLAKLRQWPGEHRSLRPSWWWWCCLITGPSFYTDPTSRPLPFMLIAPTLWYGLVTIASGVDSFPHTWCPGGVEHSSMGWDGVDRKVVLQMCLCNDHRQNFNHMASWASWTKVCLEGWTFLRLLFKI